MCEMVPLEPEFDPVIIRYAEILFVRLRGFFEFTLLVAVRAAPFAMSGRLSRFWLGIAIAVIANGQLEVRLPPWSSCHIAQAQSPAM